MTSTEPRTGPGGTFPAFSPLFWRINLAIWSFIAVLGVGTRTLFFGNVGDAVIVTVVLDTCGFLLTGAAHELLRLRPYALSPRTVIVLVVVAAFSGGLLEMAVAEGLRALSFSTGAFQTAFGGRGVPVFYYTTIFLGWALGYFWLSADVAQRAEKLRRSEAQSAAVRAELQQLRVEIDPHFLFNALNTVAAEIPESPDKALEMVRRIAGYMRYCLDHQERSVCRLADEIEAARSYLRIQEMRFDDCLACTVDLDPRVVDFPVPHLFLQGLLENAVRHGLLPTTGAPPQIRVSARLEGNGLAVVVANPGTYAPRPRPASGLGLANLRRRLELHYPGGHRFSVAQEGPLVVARLWMQEPICFG